MTIRRAAPRIPNNRVGPWKGVRTTTDPGDDPPDILQDAYNGYIPDPQGASGFYSRPGFTLLFNGVATNTGTFRGQGGFSHVDLSGTSYNFIVEKGKLYRVDSTLSTRTDVSPVGITIDAAITTRVYGKSALNNLVINDGVNRPWVATNLSATPITGTYIDFDGVGTAWVAFGPPEVWGGAFFFSLSSVNSVAARTDIAWSNPADPTTGYQQTNYDFRWTVMQTATDPIFALAATNAYLYYFRQHAIGTISGVVGPNMSTTATHDSAAANIGTQAPQSIVHFTDPETAAEIVYFTDAVGRPCQLIGRTVRPIWLQLRGIIDGQSVGFPGITKTTTTAALEPLLNLYLVAVFSPIPSQQGPPTEMYAFDAKSGIYLGRWQLGTGYQIETLCNFIDSQGRGVLVVLGSKAAPSGTSLAASGFVWSLNSLAAAGDFITTEDGVFITTEDAVHVFITSEGTNANWTDSAVTPTISAQTARIGYDIDMVLNADKASVLVGSTAPVAISAITSNLAQTTEATPTPNDASDSIYRAVAGFDGVQGRGLQVKVSPTTATAQWNLQQVSVEGVMSKAGDEE